MAFTVLHNAPTYIHRLIYNHLLYQIIHSFLNIFLDSVPLLRPLPKTQFIISKTLHIPQCLSKMSPPLCLLQFLMENHQELSKVKVQGCSPGSGKIYKVLFISATFVCFYLPGPRAEVNQHVGGHGPTDLLVWLMYPFLNLNLTASGQAFHSPGCTDSTTQLWFFTMPHTCMLSSQALKAFLGLFFLFFKSCHQPQYFLDSSTSKSGCGLECSFHKYKCMFRAPC